MDLEIFDTAPDEKTLRRFLSKIVKSGECWLWSAGLDRDGYGHFMLKNKQHQAHRVSLMFSGRGPLGRSMVSDHLCGNRACVRPSHIDSVSPRVNVFRSKKFFASGLGFQGDRCMHGHKFDGENTYVYHGTRYCRACNRAASARYKNRVRP